MSFARGTTFANRLSGGGNPTGYSESGGTVTLADELNVGTVTDAVATGDFAAGLTGAGRVFWDASGGVAYLYNTAGTRRGGLLVTTTGMDVMRADAVQSSWALSTASHTLGPILRSDGYVSWSATTATGSTTGDLRLARGATGQLKVSDPSAAGEGGVMVYDRTGVYFAGIETTNGVGDLYIYANNFARAQFTATALVPASTAGSYHLGSTAKGMGSLTLGDATAQVLLGHDGATDGLLRVSDPNGVALGRVELMAADGTTVVGRMRAAGSNLVLESVSGAVSINHAGSTVCFTESNVLRPNAAGAQSLGTASVYWSAVHSQEHRGTERSSNPTAPSEGQFVIWMSDGTGHGDDGDVLIASQAGGTTNYAVVFDHSAGTTF